MRLFPGFDVDAESVWLSMEPESVDKLVTMSYGGYEARVGVQKILELLARYEVRATFFIPDWTVEAHPRMCEAIVKAGHEVGHHGYLHKRPDPARFDLAKEEIDRGFEALKRVLGVTPVGYRAPISPSWPIWRSAVSAHIVPRRYLALSPCAAG